MGNHYYKIIKCVDCGAEIQVRTDSCTVRCKSCQLEKRKRDAGTYIFCKNCGNEFHRSRRTTQFCSRECQEQYRHKERTKVLRCEMCGAEFERPQCHVREHSFCSPNCHSKWISKNMRKEKHPRWKGNRHIQGGYVFITLDDGRKVQEHRLVAEKMLGRKLLPTEVVHHIDMNKTNNDPANLMVMSRSEHRMLHDDLIRQARGLNINHDDAVRHGVKTADVWVVLP